ncbi:MAG: hypothetical protein JKY99_04555 [Rhizobiales bacterium]|nr:hypothetical protein [Hyphomicrobiales bacterium]
MQTSIFAQNQNQKTIRPNTIRNVTPKGVTPGPQINGPLKRVQGVAPTAPEVRTRKLYRIKVIDTATFEGHYLKRKWIVVLPDVIGLNVLDTCKTANGEDWPCGQVAVRNLQRFIRLAPFTCQFAWQSNNEPLNKDCMFKGSSMIETVLKKGWAKPAASASENLHELFKSAEKQQLGIFREPLEGWQNYRALTVYGSDSELPPMPDLPLPDPLAPMPETLEASESHQVLGQDLGHGQNEEQD